MIESKEDPVQNLKMSVNKKITIQIDDGIPRSFKNGQQQLLA